MRTQLVLSCAVVVLFCGGSFAADVAPHPHEPKPKVTEYIARVTCDADGKIANIHLSGGGLPEKGIDLKADVTAYRDKLKELAAKHDKDKPAMLILELDDKLKQAYVVQLVDAGIRAGFKDVSPVPIEKKDR